MIKAIVGAGGKTTLIKQLAKKYLAEGKKVFVTTSTHMYVEENTLLTDDAEVIIKELQKNQYAMAGILEENISQENIVERKQISVWPGEKRGRKIKALSKETYEKVCQCADVVLVEADGSRQMPLKIPNDKEPVIYSNVDEIIVVCGLFALGKRAVEVVQRLELTEGICPLTEETRITAEQIQQLIMKGYVKPLREQYPEKKVEIYVNQNQTLYERAVSSLIRAEKDVSIIKQEWFEPQPVLMICGGGHVSLALVKMAACLDFYIKVMDDRIEFANKERFPQADEVICDSFENLEKYLEPDAYYVVVSRGHKDDYQCVKKILAGRYQYLGMIGSKLKVNKTFENLEKEGISAKKLGTIFAPIGLDIHAVTPGEIAISILAQMIQEKNKNHQASVSRALLESKENGVLCIIIEKKGSSPRGVGSMMLVTDNGILDSIGGGAVEMAAIEDAGNCKEVMVKEYHLNNKDSERLGMICGGSNKVLFVPI